MTINMIADAPEKYEEDDYSIPSFAQKKNAAAPQPASIEHVLIEEEPEDLDHFLKKHEGNLFHDTLKRMALEKGLKENDVFRAAQIDRKYAFRIRRGTIPKKNTVLALSLALHLNEEEAKQLLASAGYSLTSSRKTDLIVLYCLKHRIYSVVKVNGILDDYGQQVLR